MSNSEFSDGFDTLVSAYVLKNNFGDTNVFTFDEYEKSKFLTKAQEEIILEYYSGKNPFDESFEKNEEARRYLTSLVKTAKITTQAASEGDDIDAKSVFYELPLDANQKEDVWFITYEAVEVANDVEDPCMRGVILSVVPVREDEYYRTRNNPFRGPNKRRALRLDVDDDRVEIVSKYKISKYILRYLSKPTPIVLVDLSNDGLSIDGVSDITECALSSVLHRAILNRAVTLALQSRTRFTNNNE